MKSFSTPLVFLTYLLTGQASAKEHLIFALDLVRHGDRTPIVEIPNAPYEWNQQLGSLTQRGIDQQNQLGKLLRKEYIEDSGLLPSEYKEGTIYARSTETGRTVGSAEALLNGLYPPNTRGGQNISIDVIKKDKDDLLFVRPNDTLFSTIKLHFLKRKWWKDKTQTIGDKLQNWSKATGMRLDNFDLLTNLADNLFIRQLHHVPLPSGIDSQSASEIISLAEWGMVTKFKQPEVSGPTGKIFLSTLQNYVKKSIHHNTDLLYVLFSAHDSTIMSVLSQLGVNFEKVPEYASRLNFKLIENSGKYEIKSSFNGKPLTPTRCKQVNCPLDDFFSNQLE